MSDVAKEYAEKIAAAVRKDQIGRAAGYHTKSMDLATSSHLAQALRKIGPAFEGLVYEATGDPVTEEDKQGIADEIAQRLGWDKPRTLLRLIKGGSADSLMTMSQEMEALFQAVKK
jgi:hypothetical protein